MPTAAPVFMRRERKPWATSDRRTTTQRGYGASWQKLRLVVLTRDQHLCQTCLRGGIVHEAREVDHIKPKSEGGTDDLGNLESICTPCHKAKTAREGAKR